MIEDDDRKRNQASVYHGWNESVGMLSLRGIVEERLSAVPGRRLCTNILPGVTLGCGLNLAR
jgi:hypothetical protein